MLLFGQIQYSFTFEASHTVDPSTIVSVLCSLYSPILQYYSLILQNMWPGAFLITN